MKKILLILSMLAFVAGCQSTAVFQGDPTTALNDKLFPDAKYIEVESMEQIFYLGTPAKRFVRQSVNSMEDPVDGMETLVRKIFDRSNLNLLYLGSANTTAMETFESRAANCLSLSIMTYALAKEAGLGVRFQDVEIPEYWTRREGYSLLNGHINLQIYPKDNLQRIHLINSGLEVDFDPQAARKHFKRVFVDEQRVVAMFYNNKGADALLNKDYDRAYAYFKAAATLDGRFDSTFVNLGILYRLTGHYEEAETSYQYALNLDPENLTGWENLAYLYQLTGQEQEARDIITRVENKRENNPYYHYILGEQEFEKGDLDAALAHYRDALKLDKTKHEIYFGLAKTYYQMGDVRRSQLYFVKARNKSRMEQDQERYQDKLDLISRWY